jgi:NTE family protein
VAETADPIWRRLCLRQADALVLVARADALQDGLAAPAPWSEVGLKSAAPMPKPEHLVLLHPATVRPGAARAWQQMRPSAQVHHVRGGPDRPRDLARVARLIQGRGRALVLSGGGARGFAHLGVLRALEEAKIEIDAIGGTSIGAIIGAAYAADRSVAEITDVLRSSFVARNPLGDYTLPFVALVGGRTVSHLLRRTYGRLDVEDLIRPFFSVATNLTAGQTVVHRRGPLWQWLRASSAIPGVLPPVFHEGQVLVDGGVMNNLPVDVMRDGFTGEILASDIGADTAVLAPGPQAEFDWPGLPRVALDWVRGFRRPSVLRLMLSTGMVNATRATAAARSAASLVIAPRMEGIDLLEWSAFDDAIERGYVAARKALGAWARSR